MRAMKRIGVILTALLLALMLCSCDIAGYLGEFTESTSLETTQEPTQTTQAVVQKTIQIAFTVKDGPDGTVMAQEAEYQYTYDSNQIPTVLAILQDFCQTHGLEVDFSDPECHIIKSIGSVEAGRGMYWTYAHNHCIELEEAIYEKTVQNGDVIVVYLASLS